MKELKPYLIDFAAGILLAGIGLTTHFAYYSTLILATGAGLVWAGIVSALRTLYWKNPKRRKEYEARKEEARINSIDERKQFLRMKSGYITYQVTSVSLLLLAWVLALFHTDSWIIGMVFLLFIFQWAVGAIAFRVLEKRM